MVSICVCFYPHSCLIIATSNYTKSIAKVEPKMNSSISKCLLLRKRSAKKRWPHVSRCLLACDATMEMAVTLQPYRWKNRYVGAPHVAITALQQSLSLGSIIELLNFFQKKKCILNTRVTENRLNIQPWVK